MLETQEEIQLYKCYKCAASVYSDDIANGVGCRSCGSRHIQKAPANARYITGYLLHSPRLIPKFIKENVIKWG